MRLLGMGLYGCAYAFEVNGNGYVMKIYHNLDEQETLNNKYHGKYIEVNRAAFLNKYAKGSQYARFYFGDIKSGYMVMKFIDHNVKQPEKPINEDSYGFKYYDNGDKAIYNIINDHIVDYGSILINSRPLAMNKTVRWVHNKIIESGSDNLWHKKWDELYSKAISGNINNAEDVILGLMDFIRFLPPDKQDKRIKTLVNNKKLSDKLKNILIDYIMPIKPKDQDCPDHYKAIYKLLSTQREDYLKQIIDS